MSALPSGAPQQSPDGPVEDPAGSVRYSETPATNDLASGAPGAARLTTPFEALARNPRSLRAAINAKCWDCIGQDSDPAPRRRIRECGCTTCPLHAVRPYQRQDDAR